MIGTLLSYIIVGSVSFLAGFMVQLGELKRKGRRYILPFISNSSRNITLAAVTLALLSLLTIVQVQRNATETRKCEVQFQTALAYNTSINSEDRMYVERIQTLSRQSDAATSKLVTDLAVTIANPSGVSPTDTTNLISSYSNTQRTISDQLDLIAQQRQTNSDMRLPYPEPDCGN